MTRLFARMLAVGALLLCLLNPLLNRNILGIGAASSAISVRTVAPFMRRPYYGDQALSSRTISFFDHDKPSYVNDRVFVRYDGKTWRGISMASCHAGVNCYDGHNGYDLAMHFEPVLSAAAGKVIRAGWYNPINHNASFGLWAGIDHGNGIATSYGHLSALTVAVGDVVGSQWQIGTSGTSGAATGPHLHISAYYMPRWLATDPFGWSGSGRDPNSVPDRYLWTNNPTAPSRAPNLGSTGSSPYRGATVVDDNGSGWQSTGNWVRSAGHSNFAGGLHWATTTNGSQTATASWTARLRAGYYEVGVFVDDNHASSSWAPYTVYSLDHAHPNVVVRHTVHVDMSHIGSFTGLYGSINTGPLWVSLGCYYFGSAHPAHVVLSNATGSGGAQMAADAIEFVPR